MSSQHVKAAEVAAWMTQEYDKSQILDHEYAVSEIQERYGAEFVRNTADGGLGIDKYVLKEFSRLTKGRAVWSAGRKEWGPPDPV